MGPGGNSNGLLPEGREPTIENLTDARLRIVTDDYFRVLRIPLVRGRGFGPADGPGGARVMVLSERAAQRLFPGEDAIGKRIRCCEAGAGEMKTVVGIVRDVRSRGPAEDFYPEFYLPIAQAPVESFNWIQQTMTLVARARSSDPSATVAAMRAAVRSVDPSLPLHSVNSMHESIRQATASARFNTMLLGALGFLGLLLATVGIASVIAYFVSLRTHEVGVRMALGAPRRSVLLLFARQVLRPVVLGLLAGIGLSLAATRLLRSSLVGITATDPGTFAVVVAVFLACAAFAVWVPARKATRVQPARALYGG
jgi:predicted permease